MANIDHPNRYNDYDDPSIGLDYQEYDELGNPIFPEDEDDDENGEELQNQENTPAATTSPNNNHEQRQEQITNLRNNINQPPTTPENNAVPPIVPTEQPQPNNNPEQLRQNQSNEQQRPQFDHARVIEQLDQQLHARPTPPVRPKGLNNTIKFYWNQGKDWLNNKEWGKMTKGITKAATGMVIAGGALTMTSLGMVTSGGLAIFALPIAYSIATRFAIDGLAQLGQQAYLNWRHNKELNPLKNELESRINQYRELFSREEQNEESVNLLINLASEAQTFNHQIAQCKNKFKDTEAIWTAWRKTGSTVASIIVGGYITGLPIGYQDFNVRDGIYHMSRVSIRGLEFLYNAGEVIPSTVQTGSTLLGSTTHALALKEIPPQLVISLATTGFYMGYKLFQNIKNIAKAYNIQDPTFEGFLSLFKRRPNPVQNQNNQENGNNPTQLPTNNIQPATTNPENNVNNQAVQANTAENQTNQTNNTPVNQPTTDNNRENRPTPTPVENQPVTPVLEEDLQKLVDKYRTAPLDLNDPEIQTNLINEIIANINKFYRGQLTDVIKQSIPVNKEKLLEYRNNLVNVFNVLGQSGLWTSLFTHEKFTSDKVLNAFKDSTLEKIDTGNPDLDLLGQKLLACDLLDKKDDAGVIMKALPQQIDSKCKSYLEDIAKDGQSNLNLSKYYESLKKVFEQIKQPQLWDDLEKELSVNSNSIIAKFIAGKDLLGDAPKSTHLQDISNQCQALKLLNRSSEIETKVFIGKNFGNKIVQFCQPIYDKIANLPDSDAVKDFINTNQDGNGKIEIKELLIFTKEIGIIFSNFGVDIHDASKTKKIFDDIITKYPTVKSQDRKNKRILEDFGYHNLIQWKMSDYNALNIYALKTLSYKHTIGNLRDERYNKIINDCVEFASRYLESCEASDMNDFLENELINILRISPYNPKENNVINGNRKMIIDKIHDSIKKQNISKVKLNIFERFIDINHDFSSLQNKLITKNLKEIEPKKLD